MKQTAPIPPGTVIAHMPASTGIYIGSPSLAVLADGTFLASHDEFGPNSTETEVGITHVFASPDRGATWQRRATVTRQFWSTLFVHHDDLYLLGTTREYGFVSIRRSRDGGATWSEETDGNSGLLRVDGEYHCAPMPVIEYGGRLWRAMERRDPPSGWGVHFCAGMLSVPMDADLLIAANWTATNFLPSDRSWNGGDMGAWLEGNAVVTPDGELVNILRVQTVSPDEKAALVSVTRNGKTAVFDPASDFLSFPGGAKKFTIRWDEESGHYWTLASVVMEAHRRPNPGSIRNTLALLRSHDLFHWDLRSVLLYHSDVRKHGFQYVDWLFDGPDLIAACRTAFDDEEGGAHNYHDANFLTFHRLPRFRQRSPSDPLLTCADIAFVEGGG